MDIHLTEQQEILIREGIEAGRFRSADDAIATALREWEERQSRFMEAVRRGEEAADRGEFVSHAEVWAEIEKLLPS